MRLVIGLSALLLIPGLPTEAQAGSTSSCVIASIQNCSARAERELAAIQLRQTVEAYCTELARNQCDQSYFDTEYWSAEHALDPKHD